MLKPLKTVGVAMALALPLVGFGLVESAQADTAGCVTKSEFRNVSRGMSKTRVHNIFDTSGRQTYFSSGYGTRYESREYKACVHPRWSFIDVSFKNGKVDSKSAYWG